MWTLHHKFIMDRFAFIALKGSNYNATSTRQEKDLINVKKDNTNCRICAVLLFLLQFVFVWMAALKGLLKWFPYTVCT